MPFLPNFRIKWLIVKLADNEVGGVLFSFWEILRQHFEVEGQLKSVQVTGQTSSFGDERVGFL